MDGGAFAADSRPMLKVAVISPRYGAEVVGGAESLCRMLAEHMHGKYWDVTVLTSCARDYKERFVNDYPAGPDRVNGVPVLRFPIDIHRPEEVHFLPLDERVLDGVASEAEIWQWLCEIGPTCWQMQQYVQQHADDFDLFFFAPYLYATTTQILPLVRHKALLAPCAHDELPLGSRFFDSFFDLPAGLCYNTDEEKQLVFARRRGYRSQVQQCHATIGIGVELPLQGVDTDLANSRFNLKVGSYQIYIGRINRMKRCDELFAYHQALPLELQQQSPLVLIGELGMELPSSPHIRYLGMVDEAEKFSLLANAQFLVNASNLESLSIAALEAWLVGTPVVASAQCSVLKAHVTQSRGGALFSNAVEYAAAVAALSGSEQDRRLRGENGRLYVGKRYTWDVVAEQYRDLACDIVAAAALVDQDKIPPNKELPPYTKSGNIYRFSLGGSGMRLLGEGWYEAERWGSWSDASEVAELDFVLEGSGGSRVSIELGIISLIPQATIELEINGVKVERTFSDAPGRRSSVILSAVTQQVEAGAALSIRIRVQQAYIPDQSSGNGDVRSLGIGLTDAVVTLEGDERETTLPVAVVIPWFGAELRGGAEMHAFEIVTRLAQRGHPVEVLTTCCAAFGENWSENQLASVDEVSDGYMIRRFPVRAANAAAFHGVNGKLLSVSKETLRPGISPCSEEDAAIFTTENINSPVLLDFLKAHHKRYRAFLFLPYLYGPILKGLPHVADRAWLLPCLHDEVYAYLPQVADIMRAARRILFNSEGEKILASRIFGTGILDRSLVVGGGVPSIPDLTADSRLPPNWGLEPGRYLLCLGRRDPTKNVDFLVAAFCRFRQQYPQSDLKLVLAGPGDKDYGAGTDGAVIDLGLVDETSKHLLLRDTRALVSASTNESYSRVIMEAWLHGRAVLAHSACLATACAVDIAKGGWVVGETEADWASAIAKLEATTPAELDALGAKGLAYAQEYANWDVAIARFEAEFGLPTPVVPKPAIISVTRKLRRIDQLTPTLEYGDAISNHVLAVRDMLCGLGYHSTAYAQSGLNRKLAKRALHMRVDRIPRSAALLYHHSIGSSATEVALKHQGPKALIYHNITPTHFFAPYRPEFAKLLEEGRLELPTLAPHFPCSAGDSEYNVQELTECGYADPLVLPIVISPRIAELRPDAQTIGRFRDGKTNILFVGRLVPNKRQDELIECFANYKLLDPAARLILAGGYVADDPYVDHLHATVQVLGLTDSVVFTGKINDAELAAFYRVSDLYVSLSEHEGFGVPLVEAMWTDVPVLAYDCTAVGETIGENGLLLTDKSNQSLVARAWFMAIRNKELRSILRAAGRERRQAFLPERIRGRIEQIVERLERQITPE